MSDLGLPDLKSIVRCIVLQSPMAKIKLTLLEKEFLGATGKSLRDVAMAEKFSSCSAMIRTWDDFTVAGIGLSTTIEVHKVDHIFEMNKHNKKSASKDRRKFQGFNQESDTVCRRPLYGKDPFEFSSDSGSDVSSDGIIAVQQNAETHSAPKGPKLVTCPSQTSRSIPKSTIIDIQKPLSIILLDSRNPHRFWFTEYAEWQKLKLLLKTMSKFYDGEGAGLKIKQEILHNQLAVAVSYNNIWHRALVLKTLSGGQARVFYPDFGTVQDTSIEENIRYLIDEYIEMPAAAHRGVLAHIQPQKGSWTEKASNFFSQNWVMKKSEAKIFKLNQSDLSYYLAMRTSDQKMVTDILIKKRFAIDDVAFMEKDVPCPKEMSFDDFEKGKFLTEAENADDNWLPTIRVAKEKKSESLSKSNSPKQKDQSLKSNSLENSVWSNNSQSQKSNSCQLGQVKSTSKITELKVPVTDFKRLRLEVPLKQNSIVSSSEPVNSTPKTSLPENSEPVKSTPKPSIPDSEKLSLSDLTSLSGIASSSSANKATENGPTKANHRQIPAHKMDNFRVGEIKAIYIYTVNDIQDFYFYLKDEFEDILRFTTELQDVCRMTVKPNDNFTLGAEVATYADENYVRGRIDEVLEGGKMFKVFLMDFGMFVERAANKLFNLNDKFKQRPAAAYKGMLANVPEHIFWKTPEKLLEITGNGFVQAKVMRINKGVVEFLLMY